MSKMSGLFLVVLISVPVLQAPAQDKPPKPKGEAGIQRLYDDREHLYASEPKILQAARQTGGYRDEGVAFSAFTAQIPGTLPLYRYFDPDTGDNALAALPERIKAFEDAGYLRQEPLGYVYAGPQPNTRPLYELLVGEGDLFYTADAGEFNDVTGPVPGRYVGIACWVNGAGKPGQNAAVPAATTQAPSAKGRALVLDRRTDLLSWSGARHIRQNDLFQYWELQEPDFAVLSGKVPLAGKEALSIRLNGRSRSANVVSFQYDGLAPDKPVRISFDWFGDFSAPETANTWFRLWAANGWKTPYAATWYAGNSMVRGIDSEGRWSGSSTGGWKHVSLTPVKADAEGKVTVSFELQNWEVPWTNGREAFLANLDVRTAPDARSYMPVLPDPRMQPDEVSFKAERVDIRIQPGTLSVDPALNRLQEIRYTLDGTMPTGTSPLAGTGPITLGPGLHVVKAAAFAPGCEPSTVITRAISIDAPDAQTGNILQNGDFAAGAAFWNVWLNPDSSAKNLQKSVKNGVLSVRTANGGEGPWAVVATNGRLFKVEEGEVYRLTFDAWADSPRSLLFQICENGKDSDGDGNDWTPHCESLFRLGTARARHSVLLVIKGRPDGAPSPRVIDPEAQAWFEYGGSSVAVQLAAVSLERVTDPVLVKQARER